MNQRTSLQVAARVAEIPDPSRALDSLFVTGFVDTGEDDGQSTLALAHPLYRAAIYAHLAPSRRRQMHRVAAEVLGGRLALAHKVAATDTLDDSLRRGTGNVRARGALWRPFQYGGGIPAVICSVHFGVPAGGRQADDGRPVSPRSRANGSGRSVATEAGGLPASPARSLVLGVLAWDQGDPAMAERQLRMAAGAGTRRRFAIATKRQATRPPMPWRSSPWRTSPRAAREAIEAASAALAYKPLAYKPLAPGAERAGAPWLTPSAKPCSSAPTPAWRAAAFVCPHGPKGGHAADVDLLIIRGALHYFAGHLTQGIADLRTATALARHEASLQLPHAHLRLAQMLFDTGEWDEAIVQGRVALSLLSDERRTWVEAEAYATLSGSWHHGALGTSGRAAGKAQNSAAELGTSDAHEATLVARAALARARDEPGKVVDALMALVDNLVGHNRRGQDRHHRLVPVVHRRSHRQGRPANRPRAADPTPPPRRRPGPRPHRQDHRPGGGASSAAEGQLDKAEAAFRQAIELLGPDDPMLDRALLHDAFGRFLHARRNRREAVDQLRRAHEPAHVCRGGTLRLQGSNTTFSSRASLRLPRRNGHLSTSPIGKATSSPSSPRGSPIARSPSSCT